MSNSCGGTLQSTSTSSLDGGATTQAASSGGGFCPLGSTEYSAVRLGYANNGTAVTFAHEQVEHVVAT